MSKRNQQILLASIFGIIGNLILSLIKITVGIIGNSISKNKPGKILLWTILILHSFSCY